MENLRGAALMTFAMFGFAVEDMVIKFISDTLPVGQIIAMLGFGGAIVFAILTVWQRGQLFSGTLLTSAILIRNLAELIGTVGFVTAIALTPISNASAILQATPLVVTLGAAVFLREQVGWRRSSAIFVGFAGVLLIIRPGMDGFDANSLFAVLGAVSLAIRDIATRKVPRSTSSIQISFVAFLTLVPTGLLLLLVTGDKLIAPDLYNGALMTAAVVLGAVSYYAIVAAMRLGDVGFVTPFRYTRMIFALFFGVVVFSERPDGLMLLGSAIVVGSGIFTVWRERRLLRSA